MNTGVIPVPQSQSTTVAAMNSRPLSDRTNWGLPCLDMRRSRCRRTSRAPIEWATRLPSETLVNSSTTFRILMTPPLRVRAETKS